MKIGISTKIIIAFIGGMIMFIGVRMITGIFKNDFPINDPILIEIEECWNEEGRIYAYTLSRRIECKTEKYKEIYPFKKVGDKK